MTDVSVVVLVGNEALHIKRCLEKLVPLEPRQIFVVESHKGDNTHDLAVSTAKSLGWSVCGNKQDGASFALQPSTSTATTLITCFHTWPGLYAQQFNWALDNLPIKATWILRLDADEYLYPETCEEVKDLVADGGLLPDVTSLSLSLSRVFCDRKIKHGGTAHIPMVRFFKYGIGRCEDRAMDEHIVTSSGRDCRLKGEFADHNLNTMDWWREKHRGYAKREAADALAFARGEIHFKPVKEKWDGRVRHDCHSRLPQ